MPAGSSRPSPRSPSPQSPSPGAPTTIRDVAAGESGLLIVMEGMATIEGRAVRADNGEAIEEYELFYLRGAINEFLIQRRFYNGQSIKDPDGRFSRNYIHAGDAVLTARAAGLAPVSKAFHVSGDEVLSNVEFRLEAADVFFGTAAAVW